MTIGLFVWFLGQLHGRRAALAGGTLLATDTIFLLTTCFDWGPVVFQHLLVVAALAFLGTFAATGRPSALFLGFLCFGLGMWDKALFSWTLIGLTVAALAVFPRQIVSKCTRRNLARAVAGFCLGALPLLVYNATSGLATFRSNSSFTLSEMPLKLKALRTAWNGSSVLAYLVNSSETPGQPREPETGLERMSAAVHSAFGERRRNALEVGFCGALLLLPLLWRTRARRMLLFSLVAMGLAWIQMAVTKNAGGAAHHVVLLWPLPHWFMAVAFAQATEWSALRRWKMGEWLLGAVVVFLAVANLLLTNQYFYQYARYGAARSWTDAIYRLSDETNRFRDSQLVLDDWGILNPLIVLHRGRLPLIYVDDTFLAPGESEKAQTWDQGLMEREIWIGHTLAFQEFAGTNDRIVKSAASLGLRKQMIEVVPDRNGRPVFEIFRFVRSD
jgi:hypothetical protein